MELEWLLKCCTGVTVAGRQVSWYSAKYNRFFQGYCFSKSIAI